MNKNEILEQLDSGMISVDTALSFLKVPIKDGDLKRGNFIRIKIHDKKQNLHFTVPIFLIGTCFSLARFASAFVPHRKANKDMLRALSVLNSLDKRDIKALVYELRTCKTRNFIDIQSADAHVSVNVI